MPSKRATLLTYLHETLFPSIKASSGYQTSLRKVERGFKSPNALHDGEFPALFISDTDEDRQNLTRNQFQGTITAILVCYAKSVNGLVSHVEIEKVVEDVTKVLELDRTQTGLVKWTEVKKISTFAGDGGPHASVVITVEFNYVSEGVTP